MKRFADQFVIIFLILIVVIPWSASITTHAIIRAVYHEISYQQTLWEQEHPVEAEIRKKMHDAKWAERAAKLVEEVVK